MLKKGPRQFRDQWLSGTVLRAGARFASALDGLGEESGDFLSSALIGKGILSAQELGRMVERNFRIPFSQPEPESLDELALKLLPAKLCRRHMLVPFRLDENDLEILMANPLDLDAQSDAAVVSGRHIKSYFCPAQWIARLIEAAYGPAADPVYETAALREDSALEVVEERSEEPIEADDEAVSGPVSTLVNHIFVNAVKMRASDIHIEQLEARTLVRFRIDGLLRTILTLPKRLGAGPLISRIKILGGMDVAERRRPLDGRAKAKVDGFEIGLRISTLPTSFGEKAVVRILDRRQAEIPFESLGFRAEVSRRLEEILKSPEGIFLVTGATGSGKTTTLYACLHRLKSDSVNIVTAEDPVEYKLDGINQVQVNAKAGLTFASVLRSVLRQDPDVVLIGEMRDRETAEIAFEAALTGHAVFTTLHSNDCLSTITRLEQMGIERYKLASPINAISSQKLVRRLCVHCRRQVPQAELPPALRAAFEDRGLPQRLFAPAGCSLCGGSGYHGRQVIVELLVLPREARDRIAAGMEVGAFGKEALRNGWLLPLADDLYWHLGAGGTSWEEAVDILESQAQPAAQKPAAAQPRARPADAGAANAPSGMAGKDILVIDDEDVVRKVVRRILESNGCSVREARDGVEGLRMFDQQPPDLIVLDLNMPEMDGAEVIKTLRSRVRFWNVPILMVTVQGSVESQELVLNLGADDYVGKPFDPRIFVARVKALFRRFEWGRRRETYPMQDEPEGEQQQQQGAAAASRARADLIK